MVGLEVIGIMHTAYENACECVNSSLCNLVDYVCQLGLNKFAARVQRKGVCSW